MTTGTRRRRSNAATRRAPSSGSSVRLTGRGGIVVLLAASLLGAMVGDTFSMPVVTGVCFVAGCLVAAVWVRPSDVLPLVVSPPLVFFVALLIAEAVSAWGSKGFLQALAVGVATVLSDVAPWLFGGTLLVVVVTWFRGLPTAVRRFRAELRGEPGPAGVSRARVPDDRGYPDGSW